MSAGIDLGERVPSRTTKSSGQSDGQLITALGDMMWACRVPLYGIFYSLFNNRQDIKNELLRRAQDYDRRGLSIDSLYVREQLRQIHTTYLGASSQRMAWSVDDDYLLLEHCMPLVESNIDIVKYHVCRQNYFSAELVLEETVSLEKAFEGHPEEHPKSSTVEELIGLYRQQLVRLAALDINDHDVSRVTLTRVARIDNDELAENLLQSGLLENFSMDDALKVAAENNAINLAKQFLAQGANIQGIHRRQPPLFTAVQHESHKVVDYLIANGADINGGPSDSTWYGEPLICAAKSTSVHLLAVLLAHNADTEAHPRWKKATALIAAASHPHSTTAIRLLLDYGANIEALDNLGRTAVMRAVEGPQCTDVIILLLDKGANIEAHDNEGRTALIEAAGNRECPEIVKLLLDRGANIEARDGRGETALIRAALSPDCTNAMKLLLDKGANIEACDEFGWTALMRAAESPNYRDAFKLLLDKGANIEARDRKGRTPLMKAAESPNCTDAMKLLLDRGANIEAHNGAGRTALMVAAGTSLCTNAMRLLLDRGANIEARNISGLTALMMSAPHPGRIDAMKLLLDRGANMDAYDSDGWTPLMYAAVKGKNLSGVKLLVQRGANIPYETPLRIAMGGGTDGRDLEIARFLLGKGARV
ncbi:MAG: hypothetical protein Q9174_005441 [Haloplaca sp. 1 TL-2023]